MKRWRDSSSYRLWRRKCKKRDGHMCSVTGVTENLHVHHLDHANYFKHKRYDVNNGITIAGWIHTLFHTWYMGGYRKKTTIDDWNKFIVGFRKIENWQESSNIIRDKN